jgi:hypothetical protein
MDKKEKYIRYIIRDLLSKTIMEYGVEHLTVPFWVGKTYYRIFENSGPHSYPDFGEYMVNHYGVREEELEEIWDWYGWHVKSTITGDYG